MSVMDQQGGVGLEAFVRLGVEIRDGIRRLGDRWKAEPEALLHPIITQAVSAASGDLVIGVGGPTQGRRWMLRSLAVGGTLVTGAPAGTAYFVQSTTDPTQGGLVVPPTMGLRDFTTGALPQVAFYGRGEIAIDNPDKLWIFIHSPTATTQYVVRGFVEDVELGTRTPVP